jgi:iron(III) transport system permease protein
MLNSAMLAAGAVAIALPLGTLLAVLLTRYDIAWRRAALAAVAALLFVPLYVQLAGWDAAFGKLGWFSILYGSLAEPLLAGMRGAIVVHGLAAAPWVVLIVGAGLVQIDPAQEEAALLCGPPTFVLWRVTLPQAAPFLVGAAIWAAAGTTAEMTVTNIYLVNPREWTYTERFYMAYASSDLQRAMVGVLPALVALGIVAAAVLWTVVQITGRRRLARASRPVTFRAGRWRTVQSVVVWSVVIGLLGMPIVSLIAKAGFVVRQIDGQRVAGWSAIGCLGEVAAVPAHFGREIAATLEVAATAALVALVIGAGLAWRARRSRRWSAFMLAVVALGLAIPGPLVGAGLIQLLNHDVPPQIPLGDGTSKAWLLVLYDQTPLAPVVAQAIKALPLVTMFLAYSFASLSDDVLEAASLDGLPPRAVLWRVALPLRWRALVAAGIAALAVAAGDLAWAHLVTPPGLDLLQRRVFGLVHAGVEEQVAAISLVVIAAYIIAAVIALRLARSAA